MLVGALFLTAVFGMAVFSWLAGGRGAAPASSGSCPLDGPWTCSTLSVPAIRTTAGGEGGMVDVRYAIHPADEPGSGSRRVLVMLDGGPGSSGVEDAEWMWELLDPRITAMYDVVAMDARGTGRTAPATCHRASDAFGGEPTTEASSRTFVEECIRQTGLDVADLPRYASVQTAEDVEAIRIALGVDRIAVYGVSYGTVTAQIYAASHPDRVSALVLDSPIDRSLQAASMWVTAARGFETTRDASLAACGTDSDCSHDLPSPNTAFRHLLERAGAGGIVVEVPDADGGTGRRTLTAADLSAASFTAQYDMTTRMQWLRALAASDHGNDVPMVHLVDYVGGSDRAADFAYFATWCADVRASPSPIADDFAAFEAVVDAAALRDPQAREIALAIAPCVFWPGQPASWTVPADPVGVPTLILAATDDPITPISEARAIAGRIKGARMVETIGGAHGSTGEACPDEHMRAFLLSGSLPSADVRCEDDVFDSFAPLAPSPIRTVDDAVDGLGWNLFSAPEVTAWDGGDRLVLACDRGGTITLEPIDEDGRSSIRLAACAWAEGGAFDGSGHVDMWRWNLDMSLVSDRGRVLVAPVGDEWRVWGTWDGESVDLTY